MLPPWPAACGVRASDPLGEPQRFPRAHSGAAPPPVNPVCNSEATRHFTMQNSQSPPPDSDDIVLRLQNLVITEKQARLLTLMPLIATLRQQGVSFTAMAEQLHTTGLNLTADALRKTLSRWRQRTTAPNTGASPTFSPASAPPGSSPPGSQPPPPTAQASPRPPVSDITNKGDLVRLRESRDPIDLNQLAQLARKK